MIRMLIIKSLTHKLFLQPRMPRIRAVIEQTGYQIIVILMNSKILVSSKIHLILRT
jgi:hypothetical protein